MKILSSFTRVVPNLYDFLLLNTKEDILKNVLKDQAVDFLSQYGKILLLKNWCCNIIDWSGDSNIRNMSY